MAPMLVKLVLLARLVLHELMGQVSGLCFRGHGPPSEPRGVSPSFVAASGPDEASRVLLLGLRNLCAFILEGAQCSEAHIPETRMIFFSWVADHSPRTKRGQIQKQTSGIFRGKFPTTLGT